MVEVTPQGEMVDITTLSIPVDPHIEENTGYSNDCGVKGESLSKSTASSDKPKSDKSTLPNPKMEHLTQDFAHLLKVENGEENPLLMSPLTRGKLKKFTAQKGSTGGNAGSKNSAVAGSKTSGTAENGGTKLWGSSRNASSKVLGSAGNSGTKPSATSRNAAPKLSGNTGSAGSKPFVNTGSKSLGSTGNTGSRTLGSTG